MVSSPNSQRKIAEDRTLLVEKKYNKFGRGNTRKTFAELQGKPETNSPTSPKGFN